MEENLSILIVDDEEDIRLYLGDALSQDGFEVYTAKNGREGIGLVQQHSIDMVLLDLNLPDIGGLEVLKEIKRTDVHSAIIIITAFGDIRSAVEAMRLGAYDYLTKPFDIEDIQLVIKRASQIIGLHDHIELLERQVDHFRYGEIITRSRKMYELLEFVDQIADSSATVIICGETGTGKELIASRIHQKSPRSKKTFVTIDCTSLPENLLESELFGHERGAFTGAVSLRKGLFEIGNGGTVFLDEIGELPLNLQSKILRVLESKRYRRVGGEKHLATDVRILSATNRNLKELTEKKQFRKDLFFRLNVLPVNLPPLRDRKEDILPLIEHYVRILDKRLGKNVSKIPNKVLNLLTDYTWPGNVRELKNVILHMVMTCKKDRITLDNIPLEIKGSGHQKDFVKRGLIKQRYEKFPDFRKAKKKIIEDFEKNYLFQLLEKNKWNISQSARDIQMHRSAFHRLMRKHGITKPI